MPDPTSATGGPTDLLPQVKKARLTCECSRFRLIPRSFLLYHEHNNADITPPVRKAALGIRALTRMAALGSAGHLSQAAANVQQYKEESAQEVMEVSSFLAGTISLNGDDGV